MKRISRREFVATAAALGAGAALRGPALAFAEQSAAGSGASLRPAGREVVAGQARSFPMKNVRLQPGPFSAAAEAYRK